MEQRRRPQLFSSHSGAILLLLALIVATVAAVPTSVMVQNSELASNAINNNKNINNNVMMSKVKRSSSNGQVSMPGDNNAHSAVATNAYANSGLDKKSSPEIVPAAFNAPPPQPQKQTSAVSPADDASISLLTNGEIINSAIAAGLSAAAIEAAGLQAQKQQQAQNYISRAEEMSMPLHKRGISTQQLLYGPSGYDNADFYNNPYLSASPLASSTTGLAAGVPNGVWADEMDPSVVYTDLQDLDEYDPAPRAASYRNKAYDNLQSLLNSEAYLEPVVLPLQGRYYGAVDADRNKRSNLNKFNKFADMRSVNKRDTKLTPADMLALVALVEAGERARKDTDADAGYMYPAADAYPNAKSYYPSSGYASGYEYPAAAAAAASAADDVDYNAGTWLEPSGVDYYGVPVNMDAMPKYEVPREHKYGGAGNNRYSTKRFMVAKKKRSLSKPSMSYNANAEKYF